MKKLSVSNGIVNGTMKYEDGPVQIYHDKLHKFQLACLKDGCDKIVPTTNLTLENSKKLKNEEEKG